MRALPVYIFYFWILSIYFDRFLIRKELSWVYKFVVWILFFVLQLILLSRINQLLILFIFNGLLITLLGYLLYHGSIRSIIFLSIIGCATGMLSEIIVAFTFQLLRYPVEDMIFTGIVASRLILLSMVHAISIYQHQRAHNTPSSLCWFLLICITFISIFIIHTVFYLNQSSNSTAGDILSFVATLFLLLMNISFYIFYNNLADAANKQIENYMMDHQLKHYEELRANGKAQLEHFQREKHNLKNQLLAIRAYALHGQDTEIIDFINKLLSDPDFGLTPLSICENLLLDTLLSSKINIAKEHDINYTWDISVPAQLPIENTDLCILIGNAIDNAFDACMQDDMPSKLVHITIKYKSNRFYCCFENTFSHKLITSQNTMFASTKTDIPNHGHGLPSIHNIVNKYNGLLDINTESNLFTLSIILHLRPF